MSKLVVIVVALALLGAQGCAGHDLVPLIGEGPEIYTLIGSQPPDDPLVSPVAAARRLHQALVQKDSDMVWALLSTGTRRALDQRGAGVVEAANLTRGNNWILVAAVAWAVYAALQKHLSTRGFAPQDLNLLLYSLPAVTLWPAVDFALLGTLSAVFPGVRFMPTGGVDHDGALDYLRRAEVFAVGGTWIAPRDLLLRGDWSEIARRATRIRSDVDRLA